MNDDRPEEINRFKGFNSTKNFVNTEYEERALKNEGALLKYYSNKASYDQNESHEDRKLINLSLAEIAANISDTIITIINELLDPEKNSSLRSIVEIFFKGDRMIYLGMIIIAVSIMSLMI